MQAGLSTVNGVAANMKWMSIRVGVVLGLMLTYLAGCESIVNTIQGEPIREIYPGQVIAGQLSVNKHSRLKVSTVKKLGSPSTIYRTDSTTTVGQRFITTKTTTTATTVRNETFDNTYSMSETVTGVTEVWKVNVMFLSGPTEVTLQVQGDRFTPQAILFEDVTEYQAASGSKPGMLVPVYSQMDQLVAGVYKVDPKKTYYLAVQTAGEPVAASYLVGLFAKQ